MSRIVNRVGEVYSGLKIIEELGNNEVMAQCIAHGHINKYNKSSLVSESVKHCKTCKEGLEVQVGDEKGDYKVLGIKVDRVALQCIKCDDIVIRLKNTFKYAENPTCSICSGKGNFKSVKGNTYGKLKVTVDRGGGVVKAECGTCGAVGEYNKSRMTSKGYQCMCCDKKGTGIDVDQKSRVFSGGYILDEFTGDDNKQYLKVECVDCGNNSNELKGNMITHGYRCVKCYKEEKRGICPKCKKELKFKRSNRRCKCSNCGEEMSRDILSSAIDFQYRVFKNAKLYGSRDNRIVGCMQILKYDYKGRDRLNYFEAVCLDHNKKIVANMNEAKTNNHDVCECEYEM